MANTKRTGLIKTVYIGCLVLSVLMVLVGIHYWGTVGPDKINIDYLRDIAVDTMGMMVGTVLMVGLSGEDEDRQKQSMFRIIFVLIFLFFLDILSSCMEGDPNLVFSIKVVNTLVFVFEDLLGYSYWAYIREELELKGKYYKIIDKAIRYVLGFNVILDLLNWKWGYYFTVSSAGEYVNAPFEFIGDQSIMAMFLVTVVVILRIKERSMKEKLILLSFGTFPLMAYLIGSITQQYIWLLPAYLLSVLLIYMRIFSERGKKLAKQEVLLTKQSTALMISQIQPHFLYNVLTTISNLCVTDPEEAEETTILFSQYLRTNLDSLRQEEPVMFSTELGHIKTYVELEKKRFGEKLNIEYDIREVNFKVPSLGLQPIVENSIKHGIRGKNAPGHVKISSYKAEKGYMVVIEDDGIGYDMNMPVKPDGKSHVGMTNVRERLRQMCGASMKIESSPGQGCRTEIFIPEK